MNLESSGGEERQVTLVRLGRAAARAGIPVLPASAKPEKENHDTVKLWPLARQACLAPRGSRTMRQVENSRLDALLL
jgi:hypothetical protein